jgi:hypothetical protein
MFSYVQNLYFLPNQGPETGLTDITVSLTGLSGTQNGQTDVLTSLTDSSISNSTSLGSRFGDSATAPPKEDKTELHALRGHNFD